MGRTRHLPFKSLFKTRNPKPIISSPWPWPSCNQPKTLSFRLLTYEQPGDDNVNNNLSNLSIGSFFTTSSSIEYSERCLTAPSEYCSVEAAMQAMSSNRLLFDGRSDRSASIRDVVGVPFEGSVAVEVESENLYRDFRVSMKEMVEANGEVEKDLAWFEEMVGWYLKMNKRWTHEYIIGAYWDLLLEMMVSSCCSTIDSLSSCCSSSSYFSCLEEIEEVVEEGKS